MSSECIIDVQRDHPGTTRNEYIRQAWENGLAVLQPTSAQLEHGLELHRESMVIDTFGFLPIVFNEQVKQQWNSLIDAGVCGNDFHFRSGIHLRTAPTCDAA